MMHLSIEDLTFFRGRSSIDLEAIFGGHISGRRLRGVKINPLFHDPESCYTLSSSFDDYSDDPSLDSQIHVDVYESLPRPTRYSQLRRHAYSESELLDIDARSPEHSPNLNRRPIGTSWAQVVRSRRRMKEEHETGSAQDSSPGHDHDVKESGEVSEPPDVEHPGGPRETSADSDHGDLGDHRDHGDHGDHPDDMGRRLSDSSMIVYEDVDQETGLHSVISHMSSYSVDHTEEVQENILFYTSDGESPSNDLMDVPQEHNNSDWPDMEDITLGSDSEYAGSQRYDDSDTQNPCSSSSSKPLRPILLSTTSNDDSNNAFPKDPNSSPVEHKTVTFAKDTVFNEDKPKRYQKEKINLKELYHERVCGRSGMGMVNPVFVISDEKLTVPENLEDCLTDDEKAKRHSCKINLVNARPTSLDSASGQSSPSRVPDLNTPAYLQRYLDSRDTTPDNQRETITSENTPVASSAIHSQSNEMNDISAANDIILELPEDSYGRIERRKSRRRRTIKWTLLTLTGIGVVITVLALGIYFTSSLDDNEGETTTPGS